MVIRRVAAVTVALALALAVPQPAVAADRADEWRAIAVSALDRFYTLDTGILRTSAYTYAGMASGKLYGWSDPRTLALINKVYSQRHADGGYGIPFAYDALADGTVNPISTTYTVTNVGHVGPVYVEALRAGVDQVTGPNGIVWSIREQLQVLVNLTMTTARIGGPNAAFGQCVAYSRHANDAKPHACVHNVNAGVARFLTDTAAMGINRTGLAVLVVDIVRRETQAYRPATDDWLYHDAREPQDPDHNSYSAESMYFMVPQLGAEVAFQMMTRSYAIAFAPVVHLRLTGLPPAPGHMSGGTTQWCVLGDRWIPEARAYQIEQRNEPNRSAQIAWYAAADALACA